MRRSGYSAWQRLGLDLGFASFDRRFRQLAEETELVELPKRDRKERPKVPRPKHGRETLLRVLGIDPGDAGAAEAAGAFLPPVAPGDFDALEWDGDLPAQDQQPEAEADNDSGDGVDGQGEQGDRPEERGEADQRLEEDHEGE